MYEKEKKQQTDKQTGQVIKKISSDNIFTSFLLSWEGRKTKTLDNERTEEKKEATRERKGSACSSWDPTCVDLFLSYNADTCGAYSQRW